MIQLIKEALFLHVACSVEGANEFRTTSLDLFAKLKGLVFEVFGLGIVIRKNHRLFGNN